MQNRLKPIEDSKKTIAAIVQERIRDAILEGTLPAGSRIDQGQLASDLNVSLVPVREALKKLEAEGFVQIVPRRGAFVTKTSLMDMEDLYFARSVLEGQAAYHAAENLTDEKLALLKALETQMAKALDAHDFALFMRDNRTFHSTIYEAAGSHYLVNMITSLWELAERYRYQYIYLRDRAPIIKAEHRAILAACQKRDKSELRDAIITHMKHTLDGIRSYVISAEGRTTG
jgi:DNA-binding GntR family transcriptional regulator